jgi:biopolymer transport protein ExbB/TolQ
MQFFVEAMQRGGPFMWPILLAAVFSMAIAGDRIYFVFLRAGLDGVTFMAQIQKLVLSENIDRAVQLCDGVPESLLARVIRAGLVRVGQGTEEIQAGIDEAVLEVSPSLNRRTAYLPMIANVATLTGLLGTIQGLIMAFNAVAHAPAELRQASLAHGIAVAMYTTAAGLAVAIPTLVVHAIIAHRSTRIMDEVDLYALKAANLIAGRERLGGTGPRDAS